MTSTVDLKLRHMIRDLVRGPPSAYADTDAFGATRQALARKYKHMPSKRELTEAYKALRASDPATYPLIPALQEQLVVRAVRSASGIINVSVVTPPGPFSCRYNCHFCPQEPGMPRSYLSNEDAVARAAANDFDAVRQAWNRFDALERNGHDLDKIEFRILGGTFSCYPHDVADVFIRDLYYAANTYTTDPDRGRSRLSLAEEQALNVTATVHVVGLGVETRPDEITPAEIQRFRRYGVTRVELGVQHTNDDLLRRVNRGHGVAASRRAIRLLKDYGFKVEIHIMTDLPGATPAMDRECYRQVLRDDPDLTPDYMKDYPCLDVDHTEIKAWKADDRWRPYAEATPDARDLKEVLIYRQQITPPWVRVNRIQRDFREARPGCLGYTSTGVKTNLAQIVKTEAEARGIYCQCIRCSEIRGETFDPAEIRYERHAFTASGAPEWFLAAVVPRPHRNLLLGFLRLRISPALHNTVVTPELRGRTAMIRELHVYGPVTRVGTASRGAQHLGIGRRLLHMAGWIAYMNGANQIAVISGVGVRGYYARHGFRLRGTYMIRPLGVCVRNLFLVCPTLLTLLFAFLMYRYLNSASK